MKTKNFIILLTLLISINASSQPLEEKIIGAIQEMGKGNFDLAISKYDTLITE
ncbi:MAG: hypothetical protein AB8F74_21190 [Saprospiraceae bacterium]